MAGQRFDTHRDMLVTVDIEPGCGRLAGTGSCREGVETEEPKQETTLDLRAGRRLTPIPVKQLGLKDQAPGDPDHCKMRLNSGGVKGLLVSSSGSTGLAGSWQRYHPND